MKPALVIMAKAPQAGKTKTRLCPPFTAEQAAEIYAACVQDVIENAIAVSGIETFIAVTPPGGRDYFESVAPGVNVLPVEGATIGRCLDTVITELLARGYPRAAAVSGDSPDLWPEIISRGFDLLDKADVVYGPSHDGGYYFVGLKQPAPALFSDEIAWSTETVLSQSLARAEVAGLRAAVLPHTLIDVDTAADLARLWPSLAAQPADRARHTRAVLRRFAAAPLNP